MLSSVDNVLTEFFSGGTTSGTSGLNWFGGARTEAGAKINQNSALTISAFYCAVNTIADSYALLPKTVYKVSGKNTDRDTTHPVDYIIHCEPNKKLTASVFDSIMILSYFMRGNAFALIKRNNAGVVIAKEFMDPDKVSVNIYEDELYYTYNGVTYNSSEVFHVPAFCFNGLVGKSIIHYAADSMGSALGAQTFHGQKFNNKGLSLGVLESEKVVAKENKQLLQQGFSNAMQSQDPYRVAVLDEGMKYKQITLTSEQAKVFETMGFGVADVCRWFRIPLHKLHVKGEGGYNFIVQMSIEYLHTAIMPIAEKFRKESNRKLFTKKEREQGYSVHHNYNRLLQADPKARAQYYKDLTTIKAITPNEIRKLEGYNPFDKGGDEPLQMVNMQTDSQMQKSKENE